jgi:hypothetical protein
MTLNKIGMPAVTLVLLAAIAAPLNAQNTSIYGSFVGTATDPSGAGVADLVVTVTNVETGIKNSARTSGLGFYRVDGLIAGTYRVEGDHPGFKRYIKDGIALSSSQTVRADIALQVGDVTQSVEVTAAAPLINTESGKISETTDWETRKYLPTAAPSFYSTLGLAPGAITVSPPLGFYVSFHGSRTTNFDYSINGSTFSSPFAGQIALVGNFNEWLQEQSVSDVNNSAEYATVATITATSKSGTNLLHGSAVEYYSAGGFKARNPFSGPITGLTNLFAGSLGGPIKKNKAFFFFAYSGQRTSNPSNQTQTVPTNAMRSGDFSSFSSKVLDPTSGAPFPGNVIPASRISSVSTALINTFYPQVNFGDSAAFAAGNYRTQIPLHGREDDYFGRVDYRFSDKHSVFASYGFDESFGGVGRAFGGPFLTVGYRIGYRRDQHVSISDLYSLTPTLYNQFSIGWARDENFITGQLDGSSIVKEIGLQGTSPVSVYGMPTANISGLTALTITSQYQNITEDVFSLHDDLGYTHGRHRMKFGVMYTHGMSDQVPFSVNNFFGNFTFDGFATGGPGNAANAFADFLLGIPHASSLQNGQYFDRVYRTDYILGTYIQDDVQVNSKLTVNLGMRWEYHQPYLDQNGREYTFNAATQQLIVPSSKSLDLVNPLLSPVFQIVTAAQAGYPSRMVDFSKKNFAPRAGFAYRLTPAMVVRGGFGIYYDFTPPYQANLGPYLPSETFPPNVITNGVPLYQFPNPFPAPTTGVGVGSFAATGDVTNLRVPYVQQWNLTLERQFAANTAVRVSYIGTRGDELQFARNIDLPLPSTIPFTHSRVPYPNFGTMSLLDQGGTSLYQALEAYVTHRSKGGLYFTASFDWAKSLADVTGENGSSAVPSTLDPFSRSLDKGNIQWQPRLRFTSQAHWLVPVGEGRRFGSGLPTALKWALGGWEMTNVLTIASGDFLTPSYSGYDSSGLGILSGRPDQIGNPVIGNPSINGWFNPGAFAIPGANPATPLTAPAGPIGRFGTAGVGILTGPGWWQDDYGLVRQFAIKDRFRINLFALASNVFNHVNLADPATNISTPQTAGKITAIRVDNNSSGLGQRSIRLGIRLEF